MRAGCLSIILTVNQGFPLNRGAYSTATTRSQLVFEPDGLKVIYAEEVVTGSNPVACPALARIAQSGRAPVLRDSPSPITCSKFIHARDGRAVTGEKDGLFKACIYSCHAPA